MSQQTARDANKVAVDSAPVAKARVLSFNAVKKATVSEIDMSVKHAVVARRATSKPDLPKKQYTYRDLVDSDSDASGDDLPSLTRLLKTKDKNGSQGSSDQATHGLGAEPRGASSSSSQNLSRDGKASSKSKHTGTAARRDIRPIQSKQIIDLCSSD